MAKFANQKTLEVERPRTTTPPFLQISEEDLLDAYKVLTGAAFVMYLLISRNENGYKFDYSPQAIENRGIMNKGTASKVRRELEEKGYIEDGKFYVRHKKKREAYAELEKDKEQTIQFNGRF